MIYWLSFENNVMLLGISAYTLQECRHNIPSQQILLFVPEYNYTHVSVWNQYRLPIQTLTPYAMLFYLIDTSNHLIGVSAKYRHNDIEALKYNIFKQNH